MVTSMSSLYEVVLTNCEEARRNLNASKKEKLHIVVVSNQEEPRESVVANREELEHDDNQSHNKLGVTFNYRGNTIHMFNESRRTQTFRYPIEDSLAMFYHPNQSMS